ncbi:MAG: ribonuclease HII [Candidatus Paceibacterota bacterium]|nr:MAG: ribonuclease HII [Candidatus Paceibacterota bacterium]
MITPTTERELILCASGYERVIGVDEVGRGCLAGPVVVCAFSCSAESLASPLAGVRDSKLLSPRQRTRIAEELRKLPGVSIAIVEESSATIDRVNILRATDMAMRGAVVSVLTSHKSMVLLDGSHTVPDLPCAQEAIVGGDRNVYAIACASILAKVFRDELMERMAKKWPEYGFEAHKGYGTSAHLAALKKHGPCHIHRRTFAGVRELV